jgi:hypothetical protein
MIEILFGESEGGGMKAAKNYKKTDYHNGTTGFIGGNSKEVICLPLMLDIGDINVPIDSEYRKNLILEMYTINGWDDKNSIKELEDTWGKYLNEIERLKIYASKGEEFRIWYSNAPYSICGFYYVCNLLKEYNCKVSVINLPQYMLLSDNVIQFYTSWGEIDAEKFYKFLPFEKELSECELNIFASDWIALKEENSILRAFVNGKLIGVPEDFYDHIIRKEIPDGEFIMARLIGIILGKYSLGIGDWWYAKRIIKMIEQGELEVVKKQKETYRQVLKKLH